jgi:acetoin utilization protein AcuB
MRVKEIMTKGVKTVTSTSSAEAAWELMKGDRIHHLVVKDGARIAGVFSTEDAGGARGRKVRDNLRVSDLMTERVVTITPETTIKRAASVMRGKSIGSLVVVDSGRAVGIVTTSDLLELLGRGAIKPTPTGKRPALNFRAPHRKRNRAYGVW